MGAVGWEDADDGRSNSRVGHQTSCLGAMKSPIPPTTMTLSCMLESRREQRSAPTLGNSGEKGGTSTESRLFMARLKTCKAPELQGEPSLIFEGRTSFAPSSMYIPITGQLKGTTGGGGSVEGGEQEVVFRRRSSLTSGNPGVCHHDSCW